MADGIRIEVDDRELRLFIAAAQDLAGHLAPLMAELGAHVESTSKLRFRTGKGPDGTPWQPSIRALREGGRTLRDRGNLRDSIAAQSDATKAEIGPSGGPAAVYGAIHQFGGTIRAKAAPYLMFRVPGGGFVRTKEVTMPARPYMGVDDADLTALRAITVDYLAAALPRGGA